MPDCHPDHSHIDPPPAPPWRASLHLDFAFDADAGVTRMVRRAHRGPLRVQKALYPEGPRACQVIVVHPPGGVVGGDCLEIGMRIGAGGQVFATSPGAAKWYRANGRRSSQAVRLQAGEGAALEWMPQETIFYDGACVDLEHEVELGAGTPYIGSEILCFGRRAMGERFLRGQVRQRTRIRQGGRLVWHEQGLLDAAGLESPLGLQGKSVCATLLAVGRPLPAAVLARLRAADPDLALSQVKSVFVARHLGIDTEAARAAMLRVWQAVRPHLLGMDASVPRIWNT
ncbi:urease accessory protein UreD [Massilia sp. WF1]|uniref:urease accessory protein UreD n=1 Tax=unclassified Massilia TaxID=2609279 RepID=UPI00064B2856|nr:MULTISPECIES: urease accessory protein UreD [unclassified Massilia]ALK96901.1 urease accessory protein UreD [Massilia sp. WG5]KLU37968.1 urease accessory protein UreD [Massilia sp. WF1]